MDYSLAALKVLCVQLKSARQTPSQSAMTLGGILFQRAWLQGILVSTPPDGGGSQGRFLLDDGTGVIELSLSGDFRNREWKIGMYVMVVGGFLADTGEIPMIKNVDPLPISQGQCLDYHLYSSYLNGNKFWQVHKMVDLSSFPDREAMWYLEVMEIYKLFYQPFFEE